MSFQQWWQPSPRLKNALLPTLLSLALILSASPAFGSDAGGRVKNTPPEILLFSSDPLEPSEGQNGILYGTLVDANGEGDITKLELSLADAPGQVPPFASLGDLTDIPTSKPATFVQNWKLWDADAKDGKLQFEYQYGYPADVLGTYRWELEVEDEGGEDAEELMVDVIQRIDILDDHVLPDGNKTTSAWGAWLAIPGAVNVAATNFVRVQNTGNDPTQRFVLDFSAATGRTEKTFVGATDDSWEIPIENNIVFRYWETDEGSIPSAGSFTTTAVSTDGSHVFTFSGLDKVLYISYTLPALPAVLAEQDYGASFTITAL